MNKENYIERIKTGIILSEAVVILSAAKDLAKQRTLCLSLKDSSDFVLRMTESDSSLR